MKHLLPETLFTFHFSRSAQTTQANAERSQTMVACTGQRGFAAVEFIVVAIPLLFAAMTSYEVSRWYMTREAVSLALLEAGRAGSVSHARPRAIEAAFLSALTPLYAPAGAFRSPRDRMLHQINQLERIGTRRAWDIAIAHPDMAEFADFMQKDLPIAIKTGNPAINNNYQQNQHQQYPRGPTSGSTIYDANTLELHAQYLYVPVVPGMRALLRTLFGPISESGSPLATHGALPIRASITIEMQSHPVLWQAEETAHVHYLHRNAFAQLPGKEQQRTSVKAPPNSHTENNVSGQLESAKNRSDQLPNRSTAIDQSHSEKTRLPASDILAHNSAAENSLPAESACLP